MIYVVKTTEFEVGAFAEHGDMVFSGFRKRFTLLKQRNSKSERPPSTATGYFPDSQNDLRCQNNGIRSRRVRRARRQGVFRLSKMIYVVKTTEFEVGAFAEHGDMVFSGFRKRFTLLKQRNSKSERPPSTATGYFPDSQNDLRCQNNGIRIRNVRRARRQGVFRTPKTIYVVKTTEFEFGTSAECGDRVFSGFRK